MVYRKGILPPCNATHNCIVFRDPLYDEQNTVAIPLNFPPGEQSVRYGGWTGFKYKTEVRPGQQAVKKTVRYCLAQFTWRN